MNELPPNWSEPKLVPRTVYDLEALGPCPTCDGKGREIVDTKYWVEKDTPYPPLSTHCVENKYGDGPCLACHGTGKVRRIFDWAVDPKEWE